MPGTVIRNYRELKNYSQKYVASKMGISQNAYSKIENNQTQLTVHHVKQLAEILQVPITDLLKDEFEIHKPVSIHKNVTRTELMEKVELLYNKISAKHAQKHDGYMVAISLINAADHAVSGIH
jgi:transcriptional regulator with XRE-family HTH domain